MHVLITWDQSSNGKRMLCTITAIVLAAFLVASLAVLPGLMGDIEAKARKGGSWAEPEQVLEGQ